MGSVELPQKYKAVVYDKPGTISTKVQELDMPEPGPGEVLINLYVFFLFVFSVATALLCSLSVVHGRSNELAAPILFPLTSHSLPHTLPLTMPQHPLRRLPL